MRSFFGLLNTSLHPREAIPIEHSKKRRHWIKPTKNGQLDWSNGTFLGQLD